MENTNNTQQVIAINGQYTKDLSFESPNSPASLLPKPTPPKIDIALNLEVNELEKDIYEVSIEVTVKANQEETTMFILELAYCGVFTVKNFEGEQKDMILLIHCPTILFPYARRIISDVTRDGGFQPLMIDPIDFSALYRQRKEDVSKTKN